MVKTPTENPMSVDKGKEYKVTWTGKKSDPEPQRYYDWMLWKMRQVDNEETMMQERNKVTVTKTVHIQEFPTDVLVGELYNRIYDSIHDEEPRSDRFLESLGEYEKDDLRQALTNLVDNL